MAKTYDVYGIGNALVDVAFQVSDAFLEKYEVEKGVMTLVDEATQFRLIEAIDHSETLQNPGGSAANTMMALSQLGGHAFYSCKVANDIFGNQYLHDMRAADISTNYDRQQQPSGITGKCLVMITDDAERTMNSFLGISSTLSWHEVDIEAVKNSLYVYLEGYLVTSDDAFDAIKKTKKFAQKNGVKTAVTLSDPAIAEAFTERFDDLVGQKVDLLFCNEKEALIFTGTDNIDEAGKILKKRADQFAITQGGEGALVYDGTSFIDVEPYKVRAIDTNGAGDMFAGAFLYGLTHGLSHPQAGDLASKAGAKVVAQYGPRLTKEQMQQLLSEVTEKASFD